MEKYYTNNLLHIGQRRKANATLD